MTRVTLRKQLCPSKHSHADCLCVVFTMFFPIPKLLICRTSVPEPSRGWASTCPSADSPAPCAPSICWWMERRWSLDPTGEKRNQAPLPPWKLFPGWLSYVFYLATSDKHVFPLSTFFFSPLSNMKFGTLVCHDETHQKFSSKSCLKIHTKSAISF